MESEILPKQGALQEALFEKERGREKKLKRKK